jgi:hypothetical protein
MSASVKYWRLVEEEKDFIGYLSSIEPTVALAARVYPSLDLVRWQPLDTAFASNEERYLITPSRLAPQVRLIPAPDAGFKVDVVSSPILFYYRGRMLAERRLSATALSAEWTYLADDRATVIDKSDDFIRWAKRVMQWVRRAAPGWYRHKAHRITEKAEAARQAGLELIS